MAPVSNPPVNQNMGTSPGAVVILPSKPITSYNFTPRDSMNETLEDNINTTPPKKLKEKLRDESPKKDSYAGSPSKEVHNRDSIEFVRPGSSQRNKTKSTVFDFKATPPKSRPQSGYAHTPRDTIKEAFEDTPSTEAPKKRAEKLKEATPKRAESAGARSSEVNARASIEFVRPNSSRRNKTESSVFDFTPPQYKPRRMTNGVTNQRYARSPYATHEPAVNGTRHEYRPTTPFAQHNHLTQDQVFTPRKQRNLNLSPIPKTPSPEKAFKRPPPGGYSNNIFG